MTTSGTPWSAASRASASSSPTPQTSLMRSAPAARATSAMAGLVVSTLIGVSGRAARIAAMTGTTRARSSSALTATWPGRVDSPPMSRMSAPSATIRRAWATAASTGSPAAGASTRRPSPENESGVTLRMPITYVRSPQRNVAGPMRVVPRSSVASVMAVRVRAPGREDRGRRPGGCAPPRRDRATRRSGWARRPRRRARPRPRRSGRPPRSTARGTPVARQSVGKVRRREGARAFEGGADDGRSRERVRTGERGDDARDVLVGHRRGDERDRAGRQVRPEVVEGGREGGRPGRVVGTVEQHVPAAGRDQLETARPDGASRSRAGGRRPGRWRCPPPRARRASHRRWPRWQPDAARAGRPASGRAAAGRSRCRRGPSRGAAPARPRSAARPSAARDAG